MPFVVANKTDSAFYMTVLFNEPVLNKRQRLLIEKQKIRSYVEGLTRGVEFDKWFVYYLLASPGICVVLLTTFSHLFWISA